MGTAVPVNTGTPSSIFGSVVITVRSIASNDTELARYFKQWLALPLRPRLPALLLHWLDYLEIGIDFWVKYGWVDCRVELRVGELVAHSGAVGKLQFRGSQHEILGRKCNAQPGHHPPSRGRARFQVQLAYI